MNTKTRKQRDFEQRENLFIDIARNIIIESGLDALTMEQVAEKAEYSKGTLYKHFSCKDDVLAAICNNALANLAKLMEIAQSYPGQSREKIVAMLSAYAIYAERFPEEFEIIFAARGSDPWAKASEERKEKFYEMDAAIIATFRKVADLGIEEGNLKMPPGLTVDQICFGTWAQSFGIYTLCEAEGLNTQMEKPSTDEVLLTQSMWLFDGYQWQPFSHEKNYAEVAEKAAAYVMERYQKSLQDL